jgi:hypothetical protein
LFCSALFLFFKIHLCSTHLVLPTLPPSQYNRLHRLRCGRHLSTCSTEFQRGFLFRYRF